MYSGKSIEARLDTALAPIGLSTARFAALRHLVQAEGRLPLGQLASKLSCVKSNATQLVDRMEADRLVRRVPDPQDRRIIHAELTDEGQQGYNLGLEVMQEFERQLFDSYSVKEQLLLRELLSRLSGAGSEDG
jgi:DNA-binding MarR family transcriptional regulator